MKYLMAKSHSPLAKRNSVYLPDRAHSVLASMSSDRICMAQGSLTQWIIGCVTNTMTCTGHGTTIESKSHNLSVAVLWLTYESCQVRVSKLPWTPLSVKKRCKELSRNPFLDFTHFHWLLYTTATIPRLNLIKIHDMILFILFHQKSNWK